MKPVVSTLATLTVAALTLTACQSSDRKSGEDVEPSTTASQRASASPSTSPPPSPTPQPTTSSQDANEGATGSQPASPAPAATAVNQDLMHLGLKTNSYGDVVIDENTDVSWMMQMDEVKLYESNLMVNNGDHTYRFGRAVCGLLGAQYSLVNNSNGMCVVQLWVTHNSYAKDILGPVQIHLSEGGYDGYPMMGTWLSDPDGVDQTRSWGSSGSPIEPGQLLYLGHGTTQSHLLTFLTGSPQSAPSVVWFEDDSRYENVFMETK